MLAKIWTFILDYILKKLRSWLSALIKQDKKVEAQEKDAEQNTDEFQKVVDDPAKTREERRKSEDTFLNS